MKWQAGALVCLFLLLSISLQARARDVDEVLQQMLDARNQVSFVGTRLVADWPSPRHAIITEEMVIQRPGSAETIQRLLPPGRADKGPPGAAEGRRPRDGRRDRPPPPPRSPVKPLSTVAFLKHISLLKNSYEIIISAGTASDTGTSLASARTIAGRETYMVEIKPKHPGRPAKQLWLDTEKHVPLRIQDYDTRGHLRSLLVYTEINFQPPIDGKVSQHPRQNDRLGKPPKEALSLQEAQKRVHFTIRTPKSLPAGFVFEDARIITGGGKQHAHLHYTDGLALLSLFETVANNGRHQDMVPPPGHRIDEVRIGDVTCTILPLDRMWVLRWIHSASGSDTELSYTLIGDISRDELTSIAESLILGK